MELKLIDVSKDQGKIDWSKVRGNVDGAIIRCGYGSDISSQDDPQFQRNAEGCIANRIPFGVYLYSYAGSLKEAGSEAAHVIRLLKPYQNRISYPVYLDLEEAGTENGAVERAIVFGNIVEAEGYWCGIYASQYWWRTYLKNGLDRFTKWVAKHSGEKPTGISGTYDMWQYSANGKVNGINEKTDLNICYKNFPAMIKAEAPKNPPYPAYKAGNTYTTQTELKVRSGAGTNYPAKSYAQLTADAKKNDSDRDGALNKGTKVTCRELRRVGNDIWILIPSGWIAAYYRGNVYVK